MDISFKDDKFKKQCNTFKLLQQKQGQKRARKIKQRLDDLRAATVLADMKTLPGRCHELTGDRSGQLALDLDHPYRLIFEPTNTSISQKEDGGLDWEAVTAIKILGVEDYH